MYLVVCLSSGLLEKEVVQIEEEKVVEGHVVTVSTKNEHLAFTANSNVAISRLGIFVINLEAILVEGRGVERSRLGLFPAVLREDSLLGLVGERRGHGLPHLPLLHHHGVIVETGVVLLQDERVLDFDVRRRFIEILLVILKESLRVFILVSSHAFQSLDVLVPLVLLHLCGQRRNDAERLLPRRGETPFGARPCRVGCPAHSGHRMRGLLQLGSLFPRPRLVARAQQVVLELLLLLENLAEVRATLRLAQLGLQSRVLANVIVFLILLLICLGLREVLVQVLRPHRHVDQPPRRAGDVEGVEVLALFGHLENAPEHDEVVPVFDQSVSVSTLKQK